MTANTLLKRNIDALLRARRQNRKDLARWCGRSEGWISQIFTDKTDRREFPTKYYDRIAKFFGLSLYQLFLPGIDDLTERRLAQRRQGRDRRLSQAIFSEQPGDVDLIHVIRALSAKGREQAHAILTDVLLDERRGGPTTPRGPAGSENSAGSHARGRRRRQNDGSDQA